MAQQKLNSPCGEARPWTALVPPDFYDFNILMRPLATGCRSNFHLDVAETQRFSVMEGQETHSMWLISIPSGKHTKNYGKSPFFMGKLTINGHFQ
jgi:hypothetical protein